MYVLGGPALLGDILRRNSCIPRRSTAFSATSLRLLCSFSISLYSLLTSTEEQKALPAVSVLFRNVPRKQVPWESCCDLSHVSQNVRSRIKCKDQIIQLICFINRLVTPGLPALPLRLLPAQGSPTNKKPTHDTGLGPHGVFTGPYRGSVKDMQCTPHDKLA